MKKLFAILVVLVTNSMLYAQTGRSPEIDFPQYLPTIHVNESVSTHFIFSEPVQDVELSTDYVVADLPVGNVLRIRPLPGVGDTVSNLGIVTVIAQKYMVQYELKYVNADRAEKRVPVTSEDGVSLLTPEVSLSEPEMKDFCVEILRQKRAVYSVKSKKNRFEVRLNNVYTIGDYFFIDLSARNKTDIPYTVDQMRFKVEDKKITKATNNQAVEIQPVFALYNTKSFQKRYRNVLVFKKFTFPNEKVFTIELAEEQISGRQVILRVAYSDILNADTL